MRDHSQHIELSRDDAVKSMLAALPASFFGRSHLEGAMPSERVRRIEQVALDDAYGRTLAQDVRAKTDLPNVLACALDSIAAHWDDLADLPSDELPDTSAWVRGVDWEFANTGVAMPAGFDTAIVIEHVEVSDDEKHVRINALPSERFAGTRAVGSQWRQGDVMAPAGQVIAPDVAASIAAAGASSVAVLRRPVVAFIPTGDELVPPNLPFSDTAPERYAGTGHVFESNSAVVRGKVEKWAGSFAPFDIVPDERDVIRDAIVRACAVADIVVLNAGSSKGSDDWSVEVLEELGQIICHQTNHGPGHHSSYALVDGTPIVGISGPAGGASFTLDFYLRPLMRAFLGQDPHPQRIPAVLTEAFPAGHRGGQVKGKEDSLKDAKAAAKPAGEARPLEATGPDASFFSIRFIELAAREDGVLTATPVVGKAGSAATQHANAFYMLPSGGGAVPPAPGDIIHVELRE